MLPSHRLHCQGLSGPSITTCRQECKSHRCSRRHHILSLEEPRVCECAEPYLALPVSRRPVHHRQQPAWRQRSKPPQQHLNMWCGSEGMSYTR